MGRDKELWQAWISVILPALEYQLSSLGAHIEVPPTANVQLYPIMLGAYCVVHGYASVWSSLTLAESFSSAIRLAFRTYSLLCSPFVNFVAYSHEVLIGGRYNILLCLYLYVSLCL